MARTVVVEGPSALREAGRVAKGAFHIVLWSAVFIFSRAEAAGDQVPIAPYEVRFADLETSEQRTFRAVQEGVGEAQRARERSGRWPTAASLAADAIPPFADDPLDRAERTWSSSADDAARLVNYVGVPAAGREGSTWIVIITEPDPAAAALPPTDVTDDRHQSLADGTLVHIGVWLGPRLGELEPPVAFVNPGLGWRRVVLRPGP